jgi:plasmid maintenance system antidote protein VapI
MNANELADAMEIRASIRRQATSRKSVTEGANDRLADQLDQAAAMLRQQQAEIELLEVKRLAAYNIGYEDGRKAQEK